jgi:hypothetical protein
MKIFKIDQIWLLWSKMTLSGIISTKTSKSPEKSGEVQGSPAKSGVRLPSGNKVTQNNFKNTLEDDLDMFCDIISHLTSKYRPDFFGTSKISGP